MFVKPDATIADPTHEHHNVYWLVVLPIFKNMKVSWDDNDDDIWKNKTCSKPPTSNV
jgi:preprotein translocase subunit SecA